MKLKEENFFLFNVFEIGRKESSVFFKNKLNFFFHDFSCTFLSSSISFSYSSSQFQIFFFSFWKKESTVSKSK